ncbi:hypothetical protein Pse7367_0374 [Thalassoporum mexicanum PCC 7367]|nr:hypothetical protein Pse7367_0374 [Pseudanabaena sp. PCC 7367]
MLIIIFTIGVISFLRFDRWMGAASTCPTYLLSRLANTEITLHPTKVVIDPWQGRHRVYGIFMVTPSQLSRQNIIINLASDGKYCGGISHPSGQFDDVVAAPEHYVVKGFLRTRTTFWLMVKGLSKKLQDPENWQLI